MSQNRWFDVERLLQQSGPLAVPGFEPDTAAKPTIREFVRDKCRVLCVGAGGLGCELLKDLALLGFGNVDVIDMDTIDVSNLNRQFLFRKSDVGKFKAEVAADFVMRRVQGVKVRAHNDRLQDHDPDFYRQFDIVIAGLDSIEARRWINAVLYGLVEFDNDGSPKPETIIPFVDGGTEGFKGQARVILPGITSCFECTVDLFPPQKTYPLCTIRNVPRIPEHCISWASVIAWDHEKPFRDAGGAPLKIDSDDVAHMMWLYECAAERAREHRIEGVTYRLTMGVIKNIIPAVASTNAIVAAACATEAFKIATNVASTLDTYCFYNGVTGVYTSTYAPERKEQCAVCGVTPHALAVSPHATLATLVELLGADARFQFKAPSLRSAARSLYMRHPRSLEEATRPNLELSLHKLFASGETLSIVDPSLGDMTASIVVHFDEAVMAG